MVMISQKCQYAVRAVFELARRQGGSPTTIGDIAQAQAIPAKFLELILVQLKRGKIVASYRGIQGGYALTVPPARLAVGEVIRLIDGAVEPVPCVRPASTSQCPLHGECVFIGLWRRAGEALEAVFDATTFADLLEQDKANRESYEANYCI